MFLLRTNKIKWPPDWKVLDDLLDGITSVIPMIEVKLIDVKYVSADNKRLWILLEFERLHHLVRVEVKTTRRINHVNRRKSARTDNLKIRGDGLDGKSAGIVLKCIYQMLGRLNI